MSAALVISTVFEPMFVLIGSAVYAGYAFGLRGFPLLSYLVYLSILAGAVVYVRTVIARKHKTNWDLSDHKKRIAPLGILTVLLGINAFAVTLFDSAQLTRYHALWFLWAAGFFVITLVRKLSGHVSVFVFATGLLSILSGRSADIVIAACVSLVIAWSRIRLGRHTMVEVVLGASYALVLLLAVVKFSLW